MAKRTQQGRPTLDSNGAPWGHPGLYKEKKLLNSNSPLTHNNNDDCPVSETETGTDSVLIIYERRKEESELEVEIGNVFASRDGLPNLGWIG